MGNNDGSVIIKARIDVSKADKDLAKMKGEIVETEKEIEDIRAKLKAADEDGVFKAAALDAEKAKLTQMKKDLQEIKAIAKDKTASPGMAAEAKASIPGAQADIADQQARVRALQAEYNKVDTSVQSYNKKLQIAEDSLRQQKADAGALQQKINSVSKTSLKMAEAQKKAEKNAKLFGRRLSSVVRSALVFTVITQSLAKLREWMVNIVKSNEESRMAIARLKGALLTLVQPLVDKVIPAFTEFVNLLTALISKIAQIAFPLLGISIKNAAESAEALLEEQQALDGVTSSAKKAKGALAGFDEINKLSSNTNNDTITPDFPAVTDERWIDTVLSGVSDKVTAALLLGGIAMVALGSCLGSLGLVLAGLSLLGASIAIGEEYGAFSGWATKLGLDNVNQFISTAILLGGIALVVFGAIFGKIGMVLSGLGLVGASVAYSDESTKQSWADALGLNSVFDYVTVAIQLAGIALVALGARLGSLALVIAGGVILGLGIAADAIGEEKLAAWWDVLKLTNVQQWVGVALTLVGIALIAIGACMGNFVMIAAGALSLGVGTITNASEGNLKDWVTTLGLEKVAGWVTAALMLVGIALIVFGIFSANIMMIIAGAGMLGAGISVGVTSGTFSQWIDTILKALTDFKNKALEIINEVWEGFTGLFGDIKKHNPNFTGYGPDYSWMFKSTVNAPGLATGSVIPPNRQFLAVLGDNKTETEVVSPLSTMKQAMIEALSETGGGGEMTLVLEGDLAALARVLRPYVLKEDKRVGVSIVTK